MAFGKTQSDYCYPNSDVLKNNFGLKKHIELQIAESFVSRKMEQAILSNPSIAVNRFGVNLLSSIHKTLFSVTYSWAGQARTEAIAKDETAFCQPEKIVPALKEAFAHIKAHNNYKGQPLGQFISSLAATHATLNQIHAFREGNGRTNRMFMTLLARYNGYDLDYSLVPKAQQLQADRLASNGDCTALALVYASIISPLEKQNQKIHIIGGSKCPSLISKYTPPPKSKSIND